MKKTKKIKKRYYKISYFTADGITHNDILPFKKEEDAAKWVHKQAPIGFAEKRAATANKKLVLKSFRVKYVGWQ